MGAKIMKIIALLMTFYWTNILYSGLVNGANIIRTQTSRYGEFVLAKNDHVHALKHFEEHGVDDVEHCLDKCVATNGCKSVNYQYYLEEQTGNNTNNDQSGNERKHLCQLVGYDRSLNPIYNISEGWNNFDTGYSRFTRIVHKDTNEVVIYSNCASRSSMSSTYDKWFDYDAATGALKHIQSSYLLHLGSFTSGYKFSYTSSYSGFTNFNARFRRSFYGNIKFGRYCVAKNVISGCLVTKICSQFTWGYVYYAFEDLERGPVMVSLFTNLGSISSLSHIYAHKNFKDRAYTVRGYQDDMFITLDSKDNNAAFLIQGIFVPKVSGIYKFYLSCDDACDFHVGTNEKESSRKYVFGSGLSGYFQFGSTSKTMYFKAGNKYYIEGLLWDIENDEYFILGVQFPDDDYIRGIERDLLVPFN